MGPRFWRLVRTILFSLSLLLFVLVVAVLIAVLISSLGYGHRRGGDPARSLHKMEENVTVARSVSRDRRQPLEGAGAGRGLLDLQQATSRPGSGI